MKHTQGEWATSPLDNTKVWACDSYGRKVCVAWSTNEAQNNSFYPNKTQEEMEANAKLIAAAPDLLEALEKCVNAIKIADEVEFRDEIFLAEQAIEKAKL